MEPTGGDRWSVDDPLGVCRNPFATAYVSSARLASRDDRGLRRDVRSLAEQFVREGCQGAIVGPHGSGKSTLLRQLADRLEDGSRRVIRLRCRVHGDGPATLRAIALAPSGSVMCIDGWERIGWMAWIAIFLARLRGAGLVVASHRRGRLPTIVECRTSVALLAALVSDLPGHDDWFGRHIAWSDLESSLRRADGDVRDALDLLYDIFERRVRAMGVSAGVGCGGVDTVRPTTDCRS